MIKCVCHDLYFFLFFFLKLLFNAFNFVCLVLISESRNITKSLDVTEGALNLSSMLVEDETCTAQIDLDKKKPNQSEMYSSTAYETASSHIHSAYEKSQSTNLDCNSSNDTKSGFTEIESKQHGAVSFSVYIGYASAASMSTNFHYQRCRQSNTRASERQPVSTLPMASFKAEREESQPIMKPNVSNNRLEKSSMCSELTCQGRHLMDSSGYDITSLLSTPNSHGGLIIVLVLFLYVVGQSIRVIADIWLTWWAADVDDSESQSIPARLVSVYYFPTNYKNISTNASCLSVRSHCMNYIVNISFINLLSELCIINQIIINVNLCFYKKIFFISYCSQ